MKVGISDLISANAALLLDPETGLSTSGTHTPTTGDPVPMTGLFEEQESVSTEYGVFDVKMPRKATFEVAADEVIDREGTFTINSEEWQIDGIPGANNGLIPVQLTMDGTIHVGRVK